MNSSSTPADAAEPYAPTAPEPAARRRVRLAYLVSHPIQYQTPLLRRIAQDPSLDLTVFFGSDASVKGYRDEGFGVEIKWDVPLLEGYRYEFLPTLRDTGKEGIFSPVNYGLVSRLQGRHGQPPFDVLWVHGYTTILQLQGILAAKLLGIPVLIRSDSRWIAGEDSKTHLALKRICFRILGSIANGAIVVGKLNADYMRYFMGNKLPLFLLPYAVDNGWFQEQARLAPPGRSELQAELSLDPARPVILFASKLQNRKHCNELIDAYVKLAPAGGGEPHPYLLIVGDGEERHNLERQALATGLQSIRFCGFRNQMELPRFFDLATVFVLPARTEPWGLIVNEVMNAGRAVILSDHIGCIPDLITNGVEGIVYPVHNVDALADALRRILDTPGMAERMGRNALARIRQWSFEEDMHGLRSAVAHVAGSGPYPKQPPGAA